nr:PREDICTED: uncharacterized protein LOC107078639 [Lepisosteus oculatus]
MSECLMCSGFQSTSVRSEGHTAYCHVFGSHYQESLVKLIWKYLDLDPHHKLLYMGEDGEHLIPALEKTLVLLHPVLWGETADPKEINSDIEGLQHLKKGSFDKALLVNALPYLESPSQMFKKVFSLLSKSGAALLIHRPAPVTTLPFFRKAKDKMGEQDYPFEKIFESLRLVEAELEWELESVPVKMRKEEWLSLLGRKCVPMLQCLSGQDITTGLQELREGCLKYSEDTLCFEDTLLFIVAHKGQASRAVGPVIQRSGRTHLLAHGPEDVTYRLPLAEDMVKYLRSPLQAHLSS